MKKAAGRFFRGQHAGRASISWEIVGPSGMRSVISAAHVTGNDGLDLIPPAAAGGSLRRFFRPKSPNWYVFAPN
jgi:hypothetical protein